MPETWYRGFLPARALQLRSWQAFVASAGVVAPDSRFTSEALDRPTDIAVIRRPVGEDGVNGVDYSAEIAAARKAGQRIYVDCDDLLWKLPPTSPARKVLLPASLDAFANTMNAADGVICTTTGLRRALVEDVGIRVPVHVCGNGTDPALFPLRGAEHVPLRIGWLGPWKWRNDDLASIADWLVPFLNDRADRLQFWHLGTMPKDDGQIEDILPGLKAPVRKVPWYPFPCLPQSLAQVDVLIIPQRRGGDYEAFANARSPSSAIAAIASGAVVWATPIESYRQFFGAALPERLEDIVDSKQTRRQYRRAQHKLLGEVNLRATAAAYEAVFLAQV